MARPIEQELYQALMESEFDFIERGVIHLEEIFDVVRVHFHDLCDDDYLCSENCRGGANKPEWQHRVRSALGRLEQTTDKVHKFGIRGFSEFT